MTRFVLGLILCFATAHLAAAAPITITFEDMPTAGPIGEFYAGLGVHFDENWQMYDQPTQTWPAHSGEKFAYSLKDFGIITFDNPVSYVSGWFTSSSNASPSLYLEAYSGQDASGTLLAWAGIERNVGSTTLMEVGSPGIMSVKVHDNGNNFTMDDFAFDEAVPEPTALVLSGMFLAGLVVRMRRK